MHMHWLCHGSGVMHSHSIGFYAWINVKIWKRNRSCEMNFRKERMSLWHFYLCNAKISNLFFPFSVYFSSTERPRAPITLTPMLSVVIGLGASIVIGALAIIVALRLPCGGRRRNRFKRKELSQGTTTEGSPGPSDKSIGSRELDGNESDEKNPDIIPDTVDSDDQVCRLSFRFYFAIIFHQEITNST